MKYQSRKEENARLQTSERWIPNVETRNTPGRIIIVSNGETPVNTTYAFSESFLARWTTRFVRSFIRSFRLTERRTEDVRPVIADNRPRFVGPQTKMKTEEHATERRANTHSGFRVALSLSDIESSRREPHVCTYRSDLSQTSTHRELWSSLRRVFLCFRAELNSCLQ